MKPMHTVAALAASALLLWGSAQAAPEQPEATEGIPVIILELQPTDPGASGAPASEQEQAMMSMLLLQLLMGLQAQGEASDAPASIAPMSDVGQRI